MHRALLALVLPLVLALAACGGRDEGQERVIEIRYSRFHPEEITVRAGEPVRIVLRNTDPIEHEWLVGDDAMHERHRSGTHAVHDEIPTEVTIPPLTEKVTTVTFSEPGEFAYICHLPGHEEYGMRGLVRVVAH
jgi:uncharacterized cupredoxin-like copper-binding protein